MSASFSFPYYVLYREIGDQYRPVVNALFRYHEEEFFYPMLLDTGASGILLPASAADLLGLTLSELPEVEGQTFWGYTRHSKKGPPVWISLPEIDEDMGFATSVFFADWIEPWQFGLFGRDVLDYVRCCFTHERGLQFYIGFRS